MHQMPRGSLSAAILIAIIFVSKPTRAQYTADFQTNIISGVTSNWTGDYLIGSNTFADVLLIQDGGVLTNWFGYLGYEVSSSNNSALVSGQGSVWSNGFLSGIARFYVGYRGAGNSLVISNEGSVICASACWESSSGYVGYYSSSSNNVVLVTSTGSVWSSSCVHYIGLNGSGNTLVVNNGGQMIDLTGIVGGYSGNNNVVITAPGSVWSNSGSAIIGQFGVGNSLVISNGGKVVNKVGHIGTSSTNNTVLVSGPGSVWSNTTLTVGYYDSCSNSLVISGGGRVFNASGFVGYNAKSVSNSVHVADGGVWENCALCVGYQGASSSVVVAGGSVLATNITVGFASSTCDNWVQLDDGSIIVTNATTDAVFEVRNGQLILNGGALQVDRFVMTNACAQFVRTGGTFIYGTAVLDPSRDDDGDGLPNGWEQTHGLDPLNASDANVDSDGDGFTNAQEFQAGTDPQDSASAFRIIGIAPEGDDLRVTWMMGSGKTNALQSSAGDSGLYTNSFGDIFTVTNTVGSATNYLDAGAATNGTARFYRVRLVP